MLRKFKNYISENLSLSITVSLLLHLTVYFTFSHIQRLSQEEAELEKKKKEEIIEITFAEPLQKKIKKKKSKKKEIQIVEQNDKALNDEIPDNAKFLSKNNQRVVKEQRARNTGDFQNTAGQPKKSKPQKKKQRSISKRGTLPTLADLKPNFQWDKMDETIEERKEELPTTETSQSDDYLKDVSPGLQTLLSTREFVYYTYYSRIKKKLNQHWGNNVKEKMEGLFRSGRSIASTSQDRITQLIIILDAKGTLQNIQVQGQSGIHDLDDAAVEAFKEAAPFPNPPKGIVEQDGTIKIHWDFVLEA